MKARQVRVFLHLKKDGGGWWGNLRYWFNLSYLKIIGVAQQPRIHRDIHLPALNL